MKTEWLQKRVTHIDALKNPTDSQKLFSLLFKKQARTPVEDRQLAVLAKAEAAAENLAKARSSVSKMLSDEKKKASMLERKARNHELFLSAGLMGLAGLVDTQTGKPLWDRGALLGALVAVAKSDEQRRAQFKQTGDALLAQSEKDKAA
jgi:hypothetical protein